MSRRKTAPPCFLSPKQISVLHVAKKQLGLDDDTYRAVLSGVAGVESSTQLDNEGFRQVMAHFNRMGFRSDWMKRIYGERAGFASPLQCDLIRKLWRKWSDEGDAEGLDGWLESKFVCSALCYA